MDNMKRYIGTKLIKAKPMNRIDYNNLRRWKIPSGENPLDEGYFIKYEDGYVSWSPKSTFESAYKQSGNLDFGSAVKMLKLGFKASRKGWNGKNMFVVYQKGYPQGIPCNEQTAKAWGMSKGEIFKCEPYLQIRTVNGSHSMWVPSINDVLSEDWGIM